MIPTATQPILLLLLLIITITRPTSGQQQQQQNTIFTFNGFDRAAATTDHISLDGIADIDPHTRYIKLTNTSTKQFGRAFYSSPITIKQPNNNTSSSSSTDLVSSFSTTFVFCISPLFESFGGNGMAFVMSASLDAHTAFHSQYFLGLLNSSGIGNTSDHIFAVEFDTVQDLEFDDINDNHVGINVNSMVSINASEAGYWANETVKKGINLKGGQFIQAWVEYDGANHMLNVSIVPVGLARPSIPLLSTHLNLSQVLRNQTFVGFSGSTGVISGTHRLLSWSFNSDGTAPLLDLSLLPVVFPTPTLISSTPFKIGVSVGSVVAFLIICAFVSLLLYKRQRREVIEGWELEFGLHRYSYHELSKATHKFHQKELLGVGGFGRVFRGVLPQSGIQVAVKRLSRESNQGEREFIAEMASMGRLRHRNLVQLLGWSRRNGELLLVYDYMCNGSLDKMLFNKTGRNAGVLTWEQRLTIVRGVAEGMLYLHEGWEQQVLHRDIKASNVLLDADMTAKLGDFGLARLHKHGQHPHTTKVVGTLGYLAPEFARTGKATTSTDVYSFGVLLLEVMTGRRPIQHMDIDENLLLVDGVWDLYTRGAILEIVDPRFDGVFDHDQMEKVLVLGLLCAHPDATRRPSMRQVVQVLGNEAQLPLLTSLEHPNIALGHMFHVTNGDVWSFSPSSLNSSNTLDSLTQMSVR